MQETTPRAGLDVRGSAPRRAVTQAVAVAVIVFIAHAIADAADPVTLHGRTMGTTYNIKYWTDAADAPAPPDLQRSIDALLARFDEQMSTWRDDSELSRFKSSPAGQWFAVSPETAAVVARALELNCITNGASDVTVGPVLRLWGFGAGVPKPTGDVAPPSDEDLKAAMKRVGAGHLEVRKDPPALRKDVPGIEIDLSSIAPGYAIDLIVDRLADAMIVNAMVELGGEVRGVGLRADGKPWRVGVQCPPPNEQTVAQVVPLTNLALATSGDFHNAHTVDGARVTHIINPHTGRPLPYRGASVTVVADTCFAADGVATALFVMGPEAGAKWCVEHNVAAIYLTSDPNGGPPTRRTTPRFEEFSGHE